MRRNPEILLLAVLSWGQPSLELLDFLCLYFVLFSLVEAVAQGLSRAPGLMPPKVLSLPTLSSPQIATRKAYGQALAKLGHAEDRTRSGWGHQELHLLRTLQKGAPGPVSLSVTLLRTW